MTSGAVRGIAQGNACFERTAPLSHTTPVVKQLPGGIPPTGQLLASGNRGGRLLLVLPDLLLDLNGLEHTAGRLERHVEDLHISEIFTEVLVLLENPAEVATALCALQLVDFLTNVLDIRAVGVNCHAVDGAEEGEVRGFDHPRRLRGHELNLFGSDRHLERLTTDVPVSVARDHDVAD